jgi:hypothetical protein
VDGAVAEVSYENIFFLNMLNCYFVLQVVVDGGNGTTSSDFDRRHLSDVILSTFLHPNLQCKYFCNF